MKSFEEYWENYGELHTTFYNGNMKQLAKEIWESSAGNVSELLEALERIRKILTTGNQGVFEDRIITEVLGVCEKALKKARGEYE